jgi:hypothetical protein
MSHGLGLEVALLSEISVIWSAPDDVADDVRERPGVGDP